MILFIAEAILASSTSKFGIEIPQVDDEDLNSSTVRSVSWSDVTTVPKRKSHRGLDLDLSLSTEVKHQEGLERERWDEVEDKTGEEKTTKTQHTSAHAWMG